MEAKFPMEFNECPICSRRGLNFFKWLWHKLLRKPYYTDTVCRLAYKQEIVDKGRGQDVFASSEKRAVPLADPRTATLVLPVLLEHYDTCAKCGFRYCTKAEITTGKIGMSPPGGTGAKGFGPGKPSLS